MGPIALFDKSFLQSLSLDESVWFSHFFTPLVCPLFYVETLADLEKAVRAGRTPEQEVGIIARKFPELSAVPNVYHGNAALGELLGHTVAMKRVPLRGGGRVVTRNGERGIVFDESAEAEAFARWQRSEFLEVERGMARNWRAAVQGIDLQAIATQLRDMGIDASTCRTLEDARGMAQALVSARDKTFAQIALVMAVVNVPRQYQDTVVERWKIAGYRPLIQHAPYVAHVVNVELFFRFALAAHLIGSERASNRVDMAYLNYLPFCMMFVSSDDLHRRCAPHFMGERQQFVWGPDLKEDLQRINQHFMELPEDVKERGIMSFAHAPPKRDGSLVRELRSTFMGAGYDDRPPVAIQKDEKNAELVRQLTAWTEAPAASTEMARDVGANTRMTAIQRKVHKKKGSWYQVPRDLPQKEQED